MYHLCNFKKTTLISATFFITFITLFIPSCTAHKTTELGTASQSKNYETQHVSVRESDQQFLVSAANFSYDQISLGELAQYRGKTSHIKRFGIRMQEFHSNALNQLNTLATSKGVNIPAEISDKGKADIEILNEIERSAFDLKYSEMMLASLQDAIIFFEKASWESTDPQISTWARATLPIIRTHLVEAKECMRKSETM